MGRALTTSGDLTSPQPLAVQSADLPAPDGATHKVVNGGEVAYFGGHLVAMAWQGDHGGVLRTV